MVCTLNNSASFPLLSRSLKNQVSISQVGLLCGLPLTAQLFPGNGPQQVTGLRSPWWPQAQRESPLSPESLAIPGKRILIDQVWISFLNPMAGEGGAACLSLGTARREGTLSGKEEEGNLLPEEQGCRAQKSQF